MPAQSTSDVDGYIAAAPEGARPLLNELREAIRASAPKAEEGISYGMPSYHLHGVRLTYFQAHAVTSACMPSPSRTHATWGSSSTWPRNQHFTSHWISRCPRRRSSDSLSSV